MWFPLVLGLATQVLIFDYRVACTIKEGQVGLDVQLVLYVIPSTCFHVTPGWLFGSVARVQDLLIPSQI